MREPYFDAFSSLPSKLKRAPYIYVCMYFLVRLITFSSFSPMLALTWKKSHVPTSKPTTNGSEVGTYITINKRLVYSIHLNKITKGFLSFYFSPT